MLTASNELSWLALPLLRAEAFCRLQSISFLGLLSPRYASLRGFPPVVGQTSDGTRADHSIGVAQIVLNMADRLMFSDQTKRYAAAWALTHDLATWPLSHTGDAAFERVTDVHYRVLRIAMIEGAQWLPRALTIFSELKDMKVDHGILITLLGDHPVGLDGELKSLWNIIHSPMTPDSIEGMTRSGNVYGIRMPTPNALIDALYKDVFSDIVVSRTKSMEILRFWRLKSQIYDKHINHYATIEFESAWTKAIEEAYASHAIVDTLKLSEKQILDRIQTRGNPKFKAIRRYKPPLRYRTSNELKGRKQFTRNIKVELLQEFLMKVPRNI